MSVDLYYTPMSSPCRAVLLTAEAIGITLNLIEINLFEGEHLKPEFEQVSVLKYVLCYLFFTKFTILHIIVTFHLF